MSKKNFSPYYQRDQWGRDPPSHGRHDWSRRSGKSYQDDWNFLSGSRISDPRDIDIRNKSHKGRDETKNLKRKFKVGKKDDFYQKRKIVTRSILNNEDRNVEEEKGKDKICPPPPKKVRFENRNDVTIDSQDDSEEENEEEVKKVVDAKVVDSQCEEDDIEIDPKDQIILELKIKVKSLKKELEDVSLSKRKAETKTKTLDMLESFTKKNKVLVKEKKGLDIKVNGLEHIIADLKSKFESKKEGHDNDEVKKIKKVLFRVKGERQILIDSNKSLLKENKQKLTIIDELETRIKELETVNGDLENGMKEVRKKVDILKQLRASLENENIKLKMYYNQHENQVKSGNDLDKPEDVNGDVQHNISDVESKNDEDEEGSDVDKNLDDRHVLDTDSLNGDGADIDEEEMIDSSNDEPEAKSNANGKEIDTDSQSEGGNDTDDEELIDSSNDEPEAKSNINSLNEVVSVPSKSKGEETEGESDDDIKPKSGKYVKNMNDDNVSNANSQDEGEDEELIDGSNVSTESKSGDDSLNKSADVFLPSDEEYPEEKFNVGRTIVSNYFNSNETIIDYTKIPKNLFKEGNEFTASPCALNNSMIFIAANDYVAKNKFGKRFCELSPACSIAWSNGSKIKQVMILESENHPKVGRVVWSCSHHNEASVRGVKLQTQRYDYRTPKKNIIEETQSTVIDTETKDDEEKDVSSLEDVAEDVSAGSMRKRRSLTKKKQKETSFADAEEFCNNFSKKK